MAHGSEGGAASDLTLQWERRVLLLVDVVESVRLLQRHERDVVERWCRLVEQVEADLLPPLQGRLVKSLGDGMLVEFMSVPQAVIGALQMHRAAGALNAGREPDNQIWLRIGCHVADVVVRALDIFGHGVNVAQRLATLAPPGGTVVSAAVREALVEGVDVDSHDLGDCFLKHVDEPVRAYRIEPPGGEPDPLLRMAPEAPIQSTVAVIPFALDSTDLALTPVGDLIADGVIAHLSASKYVRVVSRLSTTVLSGRDDNKALEVCRSLESHYVLTGRVIGSSQRLGLDWTLRVADGQRVVGSGVEWTPLADLLAVDGMAVAELATLVHAAIFQSEAAKVTTRPLPNLSSYALMLGGIQLLHRNAQRDFDRSHELFTRLIELHPRAVEPRLWLAKWFALRAVQGMTADRAREAGEALACTSRALDEDPENAFALAIEGFVYHHLSQDPDRAEQRFAEAIQRNPSESFAHLFHAVAHGLRQDFHKGIDSVSMALATSPLDPARYLYDSIAAYLYLGAGDQRQAIEIAKRSLRLNRMHAHTWRALTVAQVEIGDLGSAQDSARQLLDVQPDLTLKAYLGGGYRNDPVRQRFAQALGLAGVPTH